MMAMGKRPPRSPNEAARAAEEQAAEAPEEGQPDAPVEDAPEEPAPHVLEDVRQVEDDQPVEAPEEPASEGDEDDAWSQPDDAYRYANEYDYASQYGYVQNGFPMYAGPPPAPAFEPPSGPAPTFEELINLLRDPGFAGRSAPTDLVRFRGQLVSAAELRRRGLL
jgi:hypothetical protein